MDPVVELSVEQETYLIVILLPCDSLLHGIVFSNLAESKFQVVAKCSSPGSMLRTACCPNPKPQQLLQHKCKINGCCSGTSLCLWLIKPHTVFFCRENVEHSKLLDIS